MIGFWVGIIGAWIVQDALASIAFYGGTEKWRWNHAIRLIRVVLGLVLIGIGALLILKG